MHVIGLVGLPPAPMVLQPPPEKKKMLSNKHAVLQQQPPILALGQDPIHEVLWGGHGLSHTDRIKLAETCAALRAAFKRGVTGARICSIASCGFAAQLPRLKQAVVDVDAEVAALPWEVLDRVPFARLELLWVARCPFPSEFLAHVLPGCASLRRLELGGRLGAGAVELPAQLPRGLRLLKLHEVEVTAESATRALASAPSAVVSVVASTPEHVRAARAVAGRVHTLRVRNDYVAGIPRADLLQLLQALTTLRRLHLYECTLDDVPPMERLEELCVDFPQCYVWDAASITARNFPRLQRLAVRGASVLGLRAPPTCRTLVLLGVDLCMDDAQLADDLPELEHLAITQDKSWTSGKPMTRALRLLERAPRLRTLVVGVAIGPLSFAGFVAAAARLERLVLVHDIDHVLSSVGTIGEVRYLASMLSKQGHHRCKVDVIETNIIDMVADLAELLPEYGAFL